MSANKQYQGFWGVVRREWDEILANRTLQFCLIYLPLGALFFFTEFFSAQKPTDLPIAIIDQDNSELSRTLGRMLDAAPELSLVRSYTDLQETDRALKEAEIYGTVYIPSGFEQSILHGQQGDVVLYSNSELLVPSGVISKAVRQVSTTMGIGIALQRNLMHGDSYTTAMAKARPVIVDSHIMFNPTLNYLFYLVSGILPAILQIFVLMVGGYVVGRELRNGKGIEWFSTANNNLFNALVGKLFPYLVIFSIIGFAYNSVLFDFIGVPMNGHRWLVELGMVFMICAYLSISVFLIAWSANMRFAISFSAILGALAFSFSGLTFPISGMPDTAAFIARMFPFTHYLELMLRQAYYGASIPAGLADLALLMTFLILALVSIFRLRKIMTDLKFYGRL